MSGSSGDRLAVALAGRYGVVRELGQGGMATVYLAEDLRHGRQVAIKVLRPELAAVIGAERFVREIRTIAALQHPHILGLIDSGEVDGTAYFVMPFVEGESLRDRLTREKQLPVEEALRLAGEVASALEYAHRRGVVHRDIKPENILLHEGQALVADFGIALAASSAGGTRMTETGMSLGTPHYMSPEQAMGEREISPRSDVYALGCVLYEMLLGEPPFTGPTAQAIVARVMTEAPRSLVAQRHTVPPHVEAVVHRALEKLPADRFASAGEFMEALRNPTLARAVTSAAPGASGRQSDLLRRLRVALPWAVAVAAIGFAAVTSAPGHRSAALPPVIQYLVSTNDSTAFDPGNNGGVFAWAPDGSAFAYVSRRGILVRYTDRLDFVRLGETRGASNIFFSPDGQWLGYRGNGDRLYKTALSGGSPVLLCDSCPGFQYEWGPDGIIRFHAAPPDQPNTRQLMSLSARGGKAELVARSDSAATELFRAPTLFPDGKTLGFTAWQRNTPRLATVDLKTRAITRYDQTGALVGWVKAGFLVLGNLDGSLIALPFDFGSGRVTGSPTTIVRDMLVNDAVTVRAGVTPGGSLVYLQSKGFAVRQLMLVTRDGKSTPVGGAPRSYLNPSFSPDGRRVAVGIRDGGGADIWSLDLGEGSLTRLTTDRISDHPIWTRDGRHVVYSSNADLWWITADRSGPPESLLTAVGNRYPSDVSADSRRVVFYQPGAGILTLAFDSAPASRLVVPAAFNESSPALSPDGRWLAYQSDETGSTEVYVRPFEAAGARFQVSLGGGSEPLWSRDGHSLYYRAADTMVAATVQLAPAFALTGRRPLFVGHYSHGSGFREYDVSPDGQHFLMLQGDASNPGIVVIHGFFDRLVAGANR
jgi:eukaryotic-like serine/threonine-protein kinase